MGQSYFKLVTPPRGMRSRNATTELYAGPTLSSLQPVGQLDLTFEQIADFERMVRKHNKEETQDEVQQD